MARYDFAEVSQSGNGVWLSRTDGGETDSGSSFSRWVGTKGKATPSDPTCTGAAILWIIPSSLADFRGLSNDITGTHSFVASAHSTSIPGHVCVRRRGVMVSKAGRDAPATEFNLNEPCTALVLLELAPCEQPEGCTATIAWDGRDLQPLSRARFYTIDPSGDSSGRVTSSLGW